MNTVLVATPLVVFALVVLFGFAGCWLDSKGKPGDGPIGTTGPNGTPAPPPYTDAVIGSGPIAYWRLSDPDGSTEAEDEIGPAPVGHPGTYDGIVELGVLPSLNVSNPVATPARFDGESSVEVAHADIFEMAEFTVEALVAPASVVSPGLIVGNMSSAGHTPSSGGWALTIVPTSPDDPDDIEGHFAALVSDGSGPAGPTPVAFDLDKLGTSWHVAMTYNGDELALYWEGAKQEWGSFPYVPNLQEPLRIGFGVKGAIQEVAVYDKALTAVDIAAHFSSNTPPDQGP